MPPLPFEKKKIFFFIPVSIVSVIHCMMTNERRKTIVVKAKKELKGTFFRLLRIHINIYIYLYKRCTSKSCEETLREYTWVHSILIRSIVEYKEMCFSTWIRTVVNFNQVPKKPNIFSRSLNGEQRKEVLTFFSSFPQKDHLRPSIIG